MARTEKQWAEARELQTKLATQGILAVYGGDSKGHGFWLYRANPDAIARYEATRGYTHLDDVTLIPNDGKRSGNPSFTMFQDAVTVS